MRTLTLLWLATSVLACDDGGPAVDADADTDADAEVESDADADDEVDADADGNPPPGCNPLAPEWDCLLPYPSDFFLAAGEGGARRIVHAGPGLPVADGAPVDFVDSRPADGFPVTPAILALFPMGVDAADLVFLTDDVAASVSDDSPTIVLDAATGERVAHFAELDPRAETDDRRALVIHTMAPLAFGTRYVVALRGLRDLEGAEIEAPSGFAALRDGEAGADPVLGPIAARYEAEVFSALESAGVGRDELQLAWDFTTGTRENRTADMVRVRELVMAACEAAPPVATVVAVEADVDGRIARRIQGTIEVPLFVESAAPGAALHRGTDGEVAQNGTVEVPFLLLVPRSVDEGGEHAGQGRLVQFGHGFFGTREEVDNGFGHDFAHQTGSVMVAVDWWGMSEPDVVVLSNDILNDFARLGRFTDRVHQAMANQIALSYAARTTIAELPELEVAGAPAYDPEVVYYYGISNGHILGSTYVALAPHVSRAAMSVGGIDFGAMMFRSTSFGPLLWMIEMVMADPLDLQKMSSMFQTVLDRVDPATYVSLVRDDLLPGGPPSREVLLHMGIGDAQVPNFCSEMQARALGLPLLAPAPRDVFGLTPVEGPIDGSAFVEFDFGIPEPLPGVIGTIPAEGNEVHGGVRALQASILQVDAFLRPDGVIQSFCDGVCDPE